MQDVAVVDPVQSGLSEESSVEGGASVQETDKEEGRRYLVDGPQKPGS